MQQQPQQSNRVVAVAAAIVLAGAVVLIGDAYYSKSNIGLGRRLLKTPREPPVPYSDSSFVRANDTLSIYLVDGRINPAYSIFQTDTLSKYGSGRFKFKIKEHHSQCDRSCSTRPKTDDDGPCIVASRGSDCPEKKLHCNYPRCRTMLVGDEYCKIFSHDVRLYYTALAPTKAYLPLGQRLDSWQAFEKIKSKPDFRIKPPSERKYAFNAIFSQSTNEGRMKLAALIDEQSPLNKDLAIFTTMAKKHHREVNNPRYEQLNNHDTNMVLLDSIFTLSPAGHNPECFRLFEAAEAGSIPVVVREDLYITDKGQHNCIDSLKRWYDAPIVVLESWDELFPSMTRLLLMEEPEVLDKMQEDLRMWYEGHMREVVAEFEDFMISGQAPTID